MRRLASEVLRNLERRIARLEKQSTDEISLSDLIKSITLDLSRAYGRTIPESDVKEKMYDFIEGVTGQHWTETEDVLLEQIKDRSDISGTASLEVNCTFIGEYGQVTTTIDVRLGRGRNPVSMRVAP